MSPSPTTATLWLRPNRERSLKRWHPWVFSGAVAQVDGSPSPGDTVLVCASDGTDFGYAAYSPASQIRARMWTFDTQQTDRLTAFVAARVTAAADRRDALSVDRHHRLGAPGVQRGRRRARTDRRSLRRHRRLPVHHGRCRSVARRARRRARRTPRRHVGVRAQRCRRTRAGRARPRGSVCCAARAPSPDLVAHEAGFRFAVDVEGGHKTGFYLDQRECAPRRRDHRQPIATCSTCSPTPERSA